jgi:hypothetical protein
MGIFFALAMSLSCTDEFEDWEIDDIVRTNIEDEVLADHIPSIRMRKRIFNKLYRKLSKLRRKCWKFVVVMYPNRKGFDNHCSNMPVLVGRYGDMPWLPYSIAVDYHQKTEKTCKNVDSWSINSNNAREIYNTINSGEYESKVGTFRRLTVFRGGSYNVGGWYCLATINGNNGEEFTAVYY